MEPARSKERQLQIIDEMCELKQVVPNTHEMTEDVPLEIIQQLLTIEEFDEELDCFQSYAKKKVQPEYIFLIEN